MLPRLLPLTAALLLGACDRTPSQGTFSGTVEVDGVRRQVSTEVLAAAIRPGEGGWVAVEVWDQAAIDSGADVLGPLCLWIRLDLLGATGELSLRQPWPEVVPPFDLDAWYCLPTSADAPLFVGMRCEEPATPTPRQGIVLDMTPDPNAPTPTTIESPHGGGDGGTPLPAVENLYQRGAVGTVQVDTAVSAACDTLGLSLKDVEFVNVGCEIPATTLRFVDVKIEATLLPVGRDWESGGASLCPAR